MADLVAAAAAVRPPMVVLDKIMSMLGVTPPQQWTDLKDTVEPSTIAQIQNAQTAAASGWSQVGAGLHTAGAQLAAAAQNLPSAAEGRTGTALTDAARRAAGNFSTLDVLCEWIKEADAERNDALLSLLEAAAALFADTVAIGAGAAIALTASGGWTIAAGVGAFLGGAILFYPIYKWLITVGDHYNAAVARYNGLVEDATRSGDQCQWDGASSTTITGPAASPS